MLYIANAFSLNMLPEQIVNAYHLVIKELNDHEVREYIRSAIEVKSIIGHEPTAQIVSGILENNIEFNRESVKISYEDRLIVAQYSGPRLEEGATELPEGAELKFFLVYLD